MLYIKSGGISETTINWHVWHVGKPLPLPLMRSRVVSIQADGDELEIILEALKRVDGSSLVDLIDRKIEKEGKGG